MTVYSHSRLGTFETCPLQYKFQYLDKIKRYEAGIEAFVGLRFHKTMEKLYGELKFKVCTLKELLDYYEEQWDKEYSEDVKITKKERTLEDYRNMGRKCIEDYYKRFHPFNQSKTLALEKSVSIDLNGDGKYKLTGFIDRLSQAADGTYEIHDYKVSGHLPEQSKMDKDRQLALYQIGVQPMWNDVKHVNLIWHYAIFDKDIISVRSPEQLDTLKADIAALIDRIESTEEFIPQESTLCGWCSYQDLCPLMKHGKKVEALPENEYLKDDGVKLVNTYREFAIRKREMNGAIKEIEEEQEKVKEAIVAYAEQEDIQVIKGSGYKVKVSQGNKYCFPPKGSEDREEIEKIIKGAEFWEGLETLDTHALGKAIDDKTIPEDLVKKLLKYITVEPKCSVSLSIDKEEGDG